MSPIERVLVLGCGYAGTAVARLARERGLSVVAHVRSEARAASLAREGFDVLRLPELDAGIAPHIDARTHVVIGFPPDGATDARVAPHLEGAAAITYVSSTGVYGAHRGVVDDSTPVARNEPAERNERAARILAAEEAHRARGATVFRCPALYGRDRGLHVRVIRGEHRIPGDGTGFMSRIHVEDLARFVLASGTDLAGAGAGGAGETFVVGDREPARHIDVVQFVCDTYRVPMPARVSLDSVHETLRADRRVDPSRALARFGVTLKYPTYREGMAPEATGFEVGGTPRGEL